MDSIISWFYGVGLLAGVLLYAVFLYWVVRQWLKGKKRYRERYGQLPAVQHRSVSLIIPARNEADGIQTCLRSMLAQDYPSQKMELIVVDDHSEDDTVAKVLDLGDERIVLHSLPRGVTGKKAALSVGIARAQSDIIITTDADCTFTKSWLKQVATAVEAGCAMVLGPVIMKSNSQLLQSWQGLDVCGTILLTGAAVAAGHPILANGANLAFCKSLFEKLDGFAGNAERASGDDIFLLQKAVRESSIQIGFTFQRAAAAFTSPSTTWSELFWQRLRWAGKTGGYTDKYLLVFQAGVYALNVGLLLGLLLPVVYPPVAVFVITAWLTKALAEYLYLYFATQEIGNRRWLRWFPISFLLHSIYVVFIGSLALLPISSRWKGRKA